jgi:hypothetical protein
MIILAIDPGNQESGYVIWNGKEIVEFGKCKNEHLKSDVKYNKRDYDLCAIEMVASYGMPVGATVFETCVWIGRFAEHAHDVNLVYRKDVKMHLCGQTRAKDSNIIQALKDRFGEKGTKKNPGLTYGLSKDVWQAFALAVYFYDTHKEAINQNG